MMFFQLKWLDILQDAKKNYQKIEYIPASPRPQKRKAPPVPPKEEEKGTNFILFHSEEYENKSEKSFEFESAYFYGCYF